jgi:hypothetical protein
VARCQTRRLRSRSVWRRASSRDDREPHHDEDVRWRVAQGHARWWVTVVPHQTAEPAGTTIEEVDWNLPDVSSRAEPPAQGCTSATQVDRKFDLSTAGLPDELLLSASNAGCVTGNPRLAGARWVLNRPVPPLSCSASGCGSCT